jgi:hypothetical protein
VTHDGGWDHGDDAPGEECVDLKSSEEVISTRKQTAEEKDRL